MTPVAAVTLISYSIVCLGFRAVCLSCFVPIEMRKEIQTIENNSFLIFILLSLDLFPKLIQSSKYLRTLRRQTFRISLYNSTLNAKIYELPEHS